MDAATSVDPAISVDPAPRVTVPAGDPRWGALTTLREDLRAAVGAPELEAATLATGFPRSRQPDHLRISGRLVPSPIPLTRLRLEPPVDARGICSLWSIRAPVAVSGDVHQRSWSIRRAGPVLPDTVSHRIESLPVMVGRWEVRLWLSDRPAGPLPAVVSGASPAYDLAACGGRVASLDISAVDLLVDAVPPDDERSLALLASAAGRFPHWRGGWTVPADATVVVVRESDRPAVGAAVRHRGDGRSDVSQVCVAPEIALPRSGSALLDAIEALAMAAGSRRVRLDGSAFLRPSVVRAARHGYAVGPSYAGDADVPVWAERTLPPPVPN